MSETAKVRLVRCPKCKNFLPELTNYSVYQCGGCGAVLGVNKRVAEAETSSDKSDDGKIGGLSEKISKKTENFNYSEKGMVNFSDGSEHDVKSNGSSSSRAENWEVLSDRVEKYRKYTQEGEGPSIYQLGSSSGSAYGGGEPVNETDGIQKVEEYLVRDQAELLLRKLDELKDQFSGCCDVNDKGKGKLPFEHYIDNDIDPFESYSHNINRHLPSCYCFHCYTKRPSPAFYNKMYPDIPNNPMLYHHENPRITNPHMHSHNPQFSYTRCPRELNSEVSSFVPRVALTTGARHCRPIAGGAPFITCYNCFGLLQLPNQVEKNKMKIRCGECSTVILFDQVNKKLLVSLNAETKRSPTKVDGSTDVAVNEGTSNYRGRLNRATINFPFNYCHNFQWVMDKESTSSPSTDHCSSSNKTPDMGSLHSTSPCTFEDEASTDSPIATSTSSEHGLIWMPDFCL